MQRQKVIDIFLILGLRCHRYSPTPFVLRGGHRTALRHPPYLRVNNLKHMRNKDNVYFRCKAEINDYCRYFAVKDADGNSLTPEEIWGAVSCVLNQFKGNDIFTFENIAMSITHKTLLELCPKYSRNRNCSFNTFIYTCGKNLGITLLKAENRNTPYQNGDTEYCPNYTYIPNPNYRTNTSDCITVWGDPMIVSKNTYNGVDVQKKKDPSEIFGKDDPAFDDIDRQNILDKVEQFIASFPPVKQDILRGIFFEGISNKEMAESTGESENFIGVLKSRAKSEIFKRLAELGYSVEELY